MIKICGVVVMILGSFAYSETADLWFAQAGAIGVFLFFSEALFEFVIAQNRGSSLDAVNCEQEPAFLQRAL
jgi:hypothetical protein